MISTLVSEYNNLSKIHFIKRAKLREQIYNEILKGCSSYQEFSERCPIPFDKFEMIGLCMSEGKTVSSEQQNWYMVENQRREAERMIECQRRATATMMACQQRSEYSISNSRPSTSFDFGSGIKNVIGPNGLTTIMQTGNMTTVMQNGKTDIYTVL